MKGYKLKTDKEYNAFKNVKDACKYYKCEEADLDGGFTWPSKKAFIIWSWLMCEKKEGRLLKMTYGRTNNFLLMQFRRNPLIVMKYFKDNKIKLKDYAMVGDKDYDEKIGNGRLVYDKRVG